MITPTKEFWEVFKNTEGALSCCEAIAIMNIAGEAHRVVGTWVELGTYKGKSCISAAYIFGENKIKMFHLVEPEFISTPFFSEVKKTVENYCEPRFIASYSIDVIGDRFVLPEPYAYVFVDSGSHQDGLPMQEVKLLEDRMVQGGIIGFHDYNSQFIEVTEAYKYLLGTGKYEEVVIDWEEIKKYVGENDLEKGNSSWHHTEMEFPCFVGALKRK